MKQTWANLCEVKDFHNQKIWSKYAINQYIYLQFAHKNLWNKNAILHTVHYKCKFNPNLEVQICYTFAKFVNLGKSIFSSSVKDPSKILTISSKILINDQDLVIYHSQDQINILERSSKILQRS